MRDFHPKLFLDGALDFQQTRVAKLHDGFRFHVDEMVVLAELVGAFVLRTIVPKLVLDDQPTVEQQVNRII